ncbi:MAG: DHH family phosphoesterase [Patescibacteria group bacterium]|nr:DHH family phosphoesterase [Patescibacteria group bacterium]
MELSPKQQAVNEIKKAEKILIIGNRKTCGDTIGSILALTSALRGMGKKVEGVANAEIESKYRFLAGLNELETDYEANDGKIIKINTEKIPVRGMKWQKDEKFLNIYLETDKNLKFEFIELINGRPKPDLIIVVDTPDLDSIDKVYEQNTELFFETPIINIDHHSGNDYFGSVNLIDLTATSTAEILVSLFEALGIKIDDPDIATSLLAGIIEDTGSFRNKSTTPKSLTVAAQLLAAGGRQQEIVKHYYRSNSVGLMKVWGKMLENLEEDEARKFAWTKIDTTNEEDIEKEDVFAAADDLLSNTKGANAALIIYKGKDTDGKIEGKLKGTKEQEVLTLAKLFGGKGTALDAFFSVSEKNLETAEKIILKKISEHLEGPKSEKEVWDVIEKSSNKKEDTRDTKKEVKHEKKIERNNNKETEDAIEEALKSISQAERDENRKEFESIREVIDRKKQTLNSEDTEIDVFDEE